MIQRTTVSADEQDLAILREEARRRGVSLATVLREVVAEAAARRRAGRPRPRLGIFAGTGEAVSERIGIEEDAPAAGRLRS
jgi:hypothetical protein